MLGKFLEFSVSTPDVLASLQFYRQLGFSDAEVGETWRHPYAVVTDGRIYIGLHERDSAAALTFVRPDIVRHLESLESTGVAFEVRRLGDNVFNEIGFRDPAGNMIGLIEARTFSPSKRKPTDMSSCGYFTEIALPATNLDVSKAFWEKYGFVGIDELDAPLPHVTCTSDYIDIGLYETQYVDTATLIFEATDLAACLDIVKKHGIFPAANHAAALRCRGAALVAPEGTQLLLKGESAL
jgi:catechol 2,3-dioxygenase-like lactoylglutathione lyase family enzyme